jgi:hypothetical protein
MLSDEHLSLNVHMCSTYNEADSKRDGNDHREDEPVAYEGEAALGPPKNVEPAYKVAKK